VLRAGHLPIEPTRTQAHAAEDRQDDGADDAASNTFHRDLLTGTS
jgi:hypothetical protein